MSKVINKMVVGIKNGEERYFNILFKSYYRHLHFFASRYVQDSDAADELVQEAFLSLWDNRTGLKCYDESGLLSWLYTVLKNNCYQYLKKQKKQRLLTSALADEQIQIDIEGLAVMDTSEETFNEINKVIQETLATLPPQCQNVFKMSRFSGLKHKEIAEELGISEKAVEGNITRALKVFKEALHEYMPQILMFIKF